MLEWIKNIGAALAIVEAIRATVVMFINAAEAPGHGPEKKAGVLKGIKNLLTENEVEEPIQKIVLGIVGGLIDLYVMALNFMEIFKHGEENKE